jgi:hypothetical protein
MASERTELQQEVVDALVESKAVDFEAIGSILGQFGERAARQGVNLGFVVGRRFWSYCIPPDVLTPVEVVEEQA